LKADTRNAAGDVLSGKGRKATRTPAVFAGRHFPQTGAEMAADVSVNVDS
jgi:hypothetical protein